jgi:hypothetical protein
MNAYEILGVSRNARRDEVIAAYRKLSKQHHPDLGGRARDFIRINKAYRQVIRDLDAQRQSKKDAAAHPTGGAAGGGTTEPDEGVTFWEFDDDEVAVRRARSRVRREWAGLAMLLLCLAALGLWGYYAIMKLAGAPADPNKHPQAFKQQPAAVDAPKEAPPDPVPNVAKHNPHVAKPALAPVPKKLPKPNDIHVRRLEIERKHAVPRGSEDLFFNICPGATDATERFVLLEQTRDSFLMRDRDIRGALGTIDQIGYCFQVNAMKEKLDLLKGWQGDRRKFEFGEPVLGLAEHWYAQGRLDWAIDANNILADLKVEDVPTRRWRLETKLRESKNDGFLPEYQDALVTLGRDPHNRSANLLVGKYECLIKGDWVKGKQNLAQANDPDYKLVGPVSASAADGDQWWRISEKEAGLLKIRAQEHARSCYVRAGNLTPDQLERVALVGPETTTNSIGMRLAFIPGGTSVRPFQMSVFEVTYREFAQFISETNYAPQSPNWETPGWIPADEQPVVNVTWADAKAFCEWLSKQEKKSYRLPTEEEWEYACKAGGEAEVQGNFRNGARGRILPVGLFRANAFGLHDMRGNVWEWCSDGKTTLGGGWQDSRPDPRASRRLPVDPSKEASDDRGFRVVME